MMRAAERAARAVCAHSLSGFCLNVGGDLGCKNGRGVSPHWTNCVATTMQLSLSGQDVVAAAVRAALAEEVAPQQSAVSGAVSGADLSDTPAGKPE